MSLKSFNGCKLGTFGSGDAKLKIPLTNDTEVNYDPFGDSIESPTLVDEQTFNYKVADINCDITELQDGLSRKIRTFNAFKGTVAKYKQIAVAASDNSNLVIVDYSDSEAVNRYAILTSFSGNSHAGKATFTGLRDDGKTSVQIDISHESDWNITEQNLDEVVRLNVYKEPVATFEDLGDAYVTKRHTVVANVSNQVGMSKYLQLYSFVGDASAGAATFTGVKADGKTLIVATLNNSGWTVYESEVASKTELTTAIATLVESKNIAPEFSASSGYEFGSLVFQDGQLYRAKELLSAGAWDSTKWESIDIDGAIPNVNHLLIKDDGTKVASQTNYLIAQDNEQTGTSVIMFSNDAVTLTNDEAVMFGMGGSAVVAANAGKVLAVNADGTGVELITPTSGDIPTKTSELTNDSGYVPIKVRQKSAQSFETPQEVRIVERDEDLVSINALSPGIGGHGPVSAVAINVDAVGSSNAGKALAISSDGSKVELKKFIDKATFTATYNTTTFADIKDAVDNGYCVKCDVSGYTYELVQALSDKITFSATNNVSGTITQETIWVNSDDTWDSEGVNIAKSSDVPSNAVTSTAVTSIVKVTELPEEPDPNTLYLVIEEEATTASDTSETNETEV